MSNSFPHTAAAWVRLRESLRESGVPAALRRRIGMLPFYILMNMGAFFIAERVWRHESFAVQFVFATLISCASAFVHAMSETAELKRAKDVGFQEACDAAGRLAAKGRLLFIPEQEFKE